MDGLPCVTSQEADSTAISVHRGIGGGWGVYKAVEGFVTRLTRILMGFVGGHVYGIWVVRA
jgi:hypothetical protein